MMTWNHFVSASDDILRRTAREQALYDAATVDGDESRNRFRYVTRPMLQPILSGVT